MEEAGQQGKDRGSSASISPLPLHGGDALVRDNCIDKSSPKDERIVSSNPSLGAAITGSEALNVSGAQTSVNTPNTYTSPDQTYFYGGYGDGSINWEQFSNYAHANNLQIVPPAIYNENASVLFHPAYGFDTQVAYSPLPPIMIDGQLYSPHQVPISPSYYSRPVSPNLPNATSALSNGVTTPASSGQEGLNENVFLNPYYLHYGSFGGGNLFGNDVFGFYSYPSDFGSGESASGQLTTSDTGSYPSSLVSGGVCPAAVGLLGSYEHSFGQIPQQYTPNSGYGPSGSSTRNYQGSGSSQGSNHGSNSVLHGGKDGKQRDQDSINMTSDHDRVPRASKTRVDSTGESKYDLASRVQIERYNQPDFVTTYENAKFFVIKSFSEDNVHKSIKYGVWASTTLGNRKLDAAYQEAKSAGGTCPVFLFFSVNASGQFCGVAEMVGPVDFENNADYWEQDRWSGQFRVQWHIIKDVPNSRFRHILLQNNDSKPVTHSRDSQEVKLEEGNAMLKIFKEHDADTSILDDFSFYDEREKDIQEKRSKERDFLAKNASITDGDASITQLSDRIAASLQLEEHNELQ